MYIQYFVFHMFDTVFYVKYNSFKKLCLIEMYSGFLMYFFLSNGIYFSYF